MKTTVISGALASMLVALSHAQSYSPFPAADAEADQISTTVVHKDGTYTTTERDTDRRKLVRQTMRKNGTLVMRSEFVLDEFDRERKGQVYDGQGSLLYISEFIYDVLGKVQEERVYNAQGKIVRRLVFQTDRFGKSKPFCMTYTNGRPMGELVPLDDPTPFSTTSTHAHSTGSSPGEIVRSTDGSRVRLSGDAVRYPSSRPASSKPTRTQRRRVLPRLFRRK